MVDLMQEFIQAVAIAWACFGLGVILFRMGCKDWHARLLSRGLLFLSPFVLTCFGVHATRENQQLAAVIAARKAEGANHGIYLAATITEHYGDGYGLTGEWYTDGTARFTGQMPATTGRMPGVSEERTQGHGSAQGEDRSPVPLSSWTRDSRDGRSL